MFCFVQENKSPRSQKYRPSLRGLYIKKEGFVFSCATTKPVSMSFYYLIASDFDSHRLVTHFVTVMSFEFIVNLTYLEQ